MGPSWERNGTLPAGEHSAPAPKKPGSESRGRRWCPWTPPVDPHRTQEPQAELCLLTLETITRAERLGIGSRPRGSGGAPRPSTVMDLCPRPRLEMDRTLYSPSED